MLRHPLVVILLLTASALTLPAPATAQGPAAVARLRPAPVLASAPTLRLSLPATSAAGAEKDHTLLGLAIGSVAGFAASWAFYDLMCEAVDNRCSPSRGRALLIGTGIGGGLGALIGHLVH